MPWCPNCKTEYQEGIEKCADCGSDLVDELPDEEEVSEAEAAEAETAGTEGFEEGEVTTEEDLEALGIDPRVLEQCDGVVSLPMAGAKTSVNVGNCAAAVLYAMLGKYQYGAER